MLNIRRFSLLQCPKNSQLLHWSKRHTNCSESSNIYFDMWNQLCSFSMKFWRLKKNKKIKKLVQVIPPKSKLDKQWSMEEKRQWVQKSSTTIHLYFGIQTSVWDKDEPLRKREIVACNCLKCLIKILIAGDWLGLGTKNSGSVSSLENILPEPFSLSFHLQKGFPLYAFFFILQHPLPLCHCYSRSLVLLLLPLSFFLVYIFAYLSLTVD